MLSVLENAISDVGHWRWWTADGLRFQVEFGFAQLWCEPLKPELPPPNVVALRFRGVRAAAFLVRPAVEMPPDWPAALQEDRREPFNVEQDSFTMTSVEAFHKIVRSMQPFRFAIGDAAGLTGDATFLLAFRAGDVGVAVTADELAVVNHRGELTPEAVVDANARWWSYWRAYWDRRDTDSPLPYDGTCEVVIPLAG